MEWADLIANLLTVGLGGLAGHVAASRQGRQSERRLARRESALELRTALAELRRLARRWGRSARVSEDEMRAGLFEWDSVLDRRRRGVPDALVRALGSVRSAAGEVFGAAVLGYALPEYEERPLELPDRLWQERLDDYLGYVLRQLDRWADGKLSGRETLLDFDGWRRRMEQFHGE